MRGYCSRVKLHDVVPVVGIRVVFYVDVDFDDKTFTTSLPAI